jgi:truncated hemoglobin YjbI
LKVFESDTLRKKTKVFSQLAEYMGTRSTAQVKSHHQKMMKRHHQVPAIILFMERKLNVKIERVRSSNKK